MSNCIYFPIQKKEEEKKIRKIKEKSYIKGNNLCFSSENH